MITTHTNTTILKPMPKHTNIADQYTNVTGASPTCIHSSEKPKTELQTHGTRYNRQVYDLP